jgi:hypothetical protein
MTLAELFALLFEAGTPVETAALQRLAPEAAARWSVTRA